jgi:hypothetical protein
VGGSSVVSATTSSRGVRRIRFLRLLYLLRGQFTACFAATYMLIDFDFWVKLNAEDQLPEAVSLRIAANLSPTIYIFLHGRNYVIHAV